MNAGVIYVVPLGFPDAIDVLKNIAELTPPAKVPSLSPGVAPFKLIFPPRVIFDPTVIDDTIRTSLLDGNPELAPTNGAFVKTIEVKSLGPGPVLEDILAKFRVPVDTFKKLPFGVLTVERFAKLPCGAVTATLALILLAAKIVPWATPPPGYVTPPTLPPPAAIEPTVAIDDTVMVEKIPFTPPLGGNGKPLIVLTVTVDRRVVPVTSTLVVNIFKHRISPRPANPKLILGKFIVVVLMFPKLVMPTPDIAPDADRLTVLIVDACKEDVKT
jgi:hypothetical protein